MKSGARTLRCELSGPIAGRKSSAPPAIPAPCKRMMGCPEPASRKRVFPWLRVTSLLAIAVAFTTPPPPSSPNGPHNSGARITQMDGGTMARDGMASPDADQQHRYAELERERA